MLRHKVPYSSLPMHPIIPFPSVLDCITTETPPLANMFHITSSNSASISKDQKYIANYQDQVVEYKFFPNQQVWSSYYEFIFLIFYSRSSKDPNLLILNIYSLAAKNSWNWKNFYVIWFKLLIQRMRQILYETMPYLCFYKFLYLMGSFNISFPIHQVVSLSRKL